MKTCNKCGQEILPSERSYDAYDSALSKSVTFHTEPSLPPSPGYECWICKQEQTGNPAYTTKAISGDFNYCYKCWNHKATIPTAEFVEAVEAKDGYRDMLRTTVLERDQLTTTNQQLQARVAELEKALNHVKSGRSPEWLMSSQFEKYVDAALASTPSDSLKRQQELERKSKAFDWLLINALPSRTIYDNGGFFCESLYTLEVIEAAMKKL